MLISVAVGLLDDDDDDDDDDDNDDDDTAVPLGAPAPRPWAPWAPWAPWGCAPEGGPGGRGRGGCASVQLETAPPLDESEAAFEGEGVAFGSSTARGGGDSPPVLWGDLWSTAAALVVAGVKVKGDADARSFRMSSMLVDGV